MKSISYILKNSFKFNIVTLISQLLSLPKGIIIALFFTPEDYGLINIVSLLSLYTGLISFGFMPTYVRESTSLMGQNKNDKIQSLKNITFTYEIIIAGIKTIALILISLIWFTNPIIKFGLILLSIQALFQTLNTIQSSTLHSEEKFTNNATANLIEAIIGFILIICLIFWLKVYGIFITNLLAVLCVTIYYLKYTPFHFQFKLDKAEFKRLFKIGIFLSIQGLAYWGLRSIDKTMIGLFLDLKELGLYSFALTFITYPQVFFIQFGNTFQPMLFKHLENPPEKFTSLLKQIYIYISLLSNIVISFLQICFFILITYFADQYLNTFTIFLILSLYSTFVILSQIPNLLQTSSVANSQKKLSKTYVIGLLINIILNWIILKLNYGIIGISFCTTFSQIFIFTINYKNIKSFFQEKNTSHLLFIFLFSFPIVINVILSIINFFILHLNILNITTFYCLILSFSICVTSWLICILLFYKKYINKTLFSNIRKTTN